MDKNNKSVWTPEEGKRLDILGDPFAVGSELHESANDCSLDDILAGLESSS